MNSKSNFSRMCSIQTLLTLVRLIAIQFAAQGHHIKLCEFLIAAGADKNASIHKKFNDFSIDYHRTPLLAMARKHKSDPKTKIDLFRLFAEYIDLTDENSDAGKVIISLLPYQPSDPSVAVWLLRSSNSCLQSHFRDNEFAQMLDVWMWMLPGNEWREMLELLTSMGRSQIDATQVLNGFSILHQALYWEQDPRLFLEKGANPHLVGLEPYISPYRESPTSFAMYNSLIFNIWRKALMSCDVDLKEFIQLEINQTGSPLHEAGWDIDTLFLLFNHYGKASLDGDSDLTCDRLARGDLEPCDDCPKKWAILRVEPKWLQKLERIKRRLDLNQLVAPSRPDEDLLSAYPSDTPGVASNLDNADIHVAKPDSDGINDSAYSKDDDSSTENSQDHDSSTAIDILNLSFEDDELLCMKCWENYKKLGYNPRRPLSHDSTADDGSPEDELRSDDASDSSSLSDQYSPFHVHS